MKPALSKACAGGLSKEMLTLEPVRMVKMKHSEIKDGQLLLIKPAEELAVQILELSNVDQLSDFHLTATLFYDVGSNDQCEVDSSNGPAKRLQGALEELLVHYPAAAGRLRRSEIEGRLEIEYNSSHGVQFVVVHANIALCELGDVSLPHPSFDLLCPNLPKQSSDSSGKYLPHPVMAIQVTTFTCGGFTLAHMCSHAFLDGYGAATFLQNLCSIARGAGLITKPWPDILNSRREIMKPRVPPSPTMRHTYIRTRPQREAACGQVMQLNGEATRFVFSTAALQALRRRASISNFEEKLCSRYQALAGLLWVARAKSLVAGSCAPLDQELPLRIPMNMREKGIPKLTGEYVGNAVFQITVSATLQELCESSLPYVVAKIKSAFAGMPHILPECVQSQTDYIELQLKAGLAPYIDHSCLLGMLSFVGLPFYDTDCGWGRPVYCGWPSRQMDDQHLLIVDHPGARAWTVFAVFKSQKEHASFQAEIAEFIS